MSKIRQDQQMPRPWQNKDQNQTRTKVRPLLGRSATEPPIPRPSLSPELFKQDKNKHWDSDLNETIQVQDKYGDPNQKEFVNGWLCGWRYVIPLNTPCLYNNLQVPRKDKVPLYINGCLT